ncbi:hypothetical protein LOTGIDRAFT_171732 [Lottia gigantea]|uniref:Uncharacterized protein n=1 Tax=Lottia gigantea TaxID=225164 RepID=V4AGF9_LOTGI|nr:hypothetical protein LOTGIDRAFT_171732 [Lottia gigantea]ESP03129.1 hypothetical protein LOTGIDRAFT_171732 [Lottia gigantea]
MDVDLLKFIWKLDILGLSLFICLLSVIQGSDGFILEKTVSVCNGPCAKVSLTCPPEHGIAIREALFGVHPNGPTCPATTNCDRIQSDICCEKTPSTDCILPYPVERLEPLHKGCSGKEKCEVDIVGNQDLAKVCNTGSSTPQPNTTYTILDYVCINDTFTADFCSEQTITVSGRTVFAVFDAKSAQTRSSSRVCTCVAHSTTWPIENPISVFVVDIRLNQLESTQCSDSMVSISAGKTIKDINCKSVHDPGFPYPFVSVLNSTTVALAQLVLHDETPEYVWLGFEASLDDEIRVSCGLHGWKNGFEGTGITVSPLSPNGNQQVQPPTDDSAAEDLGYPLVVVIGGFLGGALLTFIITMIILLAIRKRNTKPKPSASVEPDLIEPYATIEPAPAPRPKKAAKKSIKVDEHVVFEEPVINYADPWDVRTTMNNMADGEFPNAVYVDASDVRNKKKADKQKSRELPVVNAGSEYVDASAVRKKKIQDQNSSAEKDVEFREKISAKVKKTGEYDRLSREKERDCPTPPGYSHLKGVYMDIEKDDSIESNSQPDESIYENSDTIRRGKTGKLALPVDKHNDSDGGSDSSHNRNPHMSHYELAMALKAKQ